MSTQDVAGRRAALSDTKRALLEARLRGAAPASAAPFEGVTRAAGPGPEHPASFAQERMFFLAQLAPESPMYHVPLTWLVRGDADVAVLQRALAELVRRHQALRTVYATSAGGELRQIVRDPSPVPVEVRDVRAKVGADWVEDARALVTDEVARPLPPLTQGPVLRATLLRVTDERSVLVITFHHVAVDGWSMGIVGGELHALYEAFAEGRPSPLAEPALRYADYTVWQRGRLRGEALERLSAFWREHLKDAPVLELPTDRPRPPVPSHVGRVHRFWLDSAATAGLRALCVAEQATLNMGMVATLAALLSRVAEQERVVLGTVVAGRGRPELEPIVGLFANTLAINVDVSGDPPFREIVRRARATVLAADRHQEMPFERVVEVLGVERDPSRSPVFQVFYSHAPPGGGDGPGGRLDPRPLGPADGVEAMETGAAQFDLGVTTQERGDRIGVLLEYAADLFEPATIERLGRQLDTLLSAAVANPGAPLSSLPMTTGEERARLLAWGVDEHNAGVEGTLVERFEAQVARAPDAPALEYADAAWTYGQLDARANQLARRLMALGVRPGQAVGVAAGQSAAMVAALVGIVKAGAAVAPLDPEYPVDRLAGMMDDARIGVVVTERGHPSAVRERGMTALDLVDDAAAIAAEDAGPLARRAGPESIAYLAFTSGSTGHPKASMTPHRALVRTVAGARWVQAGPEDRVAQSSGLSFDGAVVEVWLALTNGATVVGIGTDVLLDSAAYARTLRERGITIAFLTTPLFNRHARQVPGIFAGLRYVNFGGEAADPEAVRACLAGGGPAHLQNLYGPAENVILATAHDVRELAADASTVSIGVPVDDTRCYVLDPAGHLCGTGVPGELFVGGGRVSAGYVARPRLTAQRYVPDPFSPVPGARMYRTGDRVRWTEAGVLEFMDRLDTQVKVRGFRIEPGEVEAALRAHPAVRDCVVAVREDVPGDRRLIGWLVPSGLDAPPAGELRTFLRQRLPDYMVPSAFVPVDVVPLTPNGKVDFRALPAPGRGADPAEEYVAPRDAVEDLVAEVWAEVLRVDRVGVTQSFFALGGHSLLATQVVVRLRETFEVEIPLRVFFQDPTVAGLAAAVQDAGSPVLAAMVDELAGLSAEDIEALLAEEGV